MNSDNIRNFVFILTTLIPTAIGQVNLTSPASPAAAEPGATLITLTGSAFPPGSIVAAQVNVKLEPATVGAGPTLTTVASGVQTVVGTTRRVTFIVPVSLVVSQPTLYGVLVSGSTAIGTSFSSTNAAQLTIQPIAGIISAVPTSIQPGQVAVMLIRTQFGSFVQGSTEAVLGLGLSVGVLPLGAQAAATDAFGNPGLVLVADTNTLLALVRASGTAAIGNRELVVRQGPLSYRRSDALAVQAAASANLNTAVVSLTSPTAPESGTPGISTFTLSATGLPTGTLQASQFRLFLEPSGISAPSLTFAPAAIAAETNGRRDITFQVPASLTLNSLTDYLITLYGSTSNYGQLPTGTTVLSSNRTLVRIGPPTAPSPTLTITITSA